MCESVGMEPKLRTVELHCERLGIEIVTVQNDYVRIEEAQFTLEL